MTMVRSRVESTLFFLPHTFFFSLINSQCWNFQVHTKCRLLRPAQQCPRPSEVIQVTALWVPKIDGLVEENLDKTSKCQCWQWRKNYPCCDMIRVFRKESTLVISLIWSLPWGPEITSVKWNSCFDGKFVHWRKTSAFGEYFVPEGNFAICCHLPTCCHLIRDWEKSPNSSSRSSLLYRHFCVKEESNRERDLCRSKFSCRIEIFCHGEKLP